MSHRHHASLVIVAVTAVALGLSGCATQTQAASTPSSAGSASSSSPSASPSSASSGQPLPAARMICSQETQRNIAKILAISNPSPPAPSWANDRYTCTYTVPGGTLRLSVQQSNDDAAARSYFTAQQKTAPGAEAVQGLPSLGLPSYLTPDGKASFVKDNMTLLVDASHLPATKPGQPTKTHLAYQIATAILACWNG